MDEKFIRTELLLGSEALEKLKNSRVAVFGIGGVGSYVAEALCRSAVGTLDFIDNDTVSLSNINRQLIALTSTVGKYKTEVMAERCKDINPDIKINVHNEFFTPATSSKFDFSQYDYVVDAIDTVAGKIELVLKANDAKTQIISSMGAGNKLNPAMFEVADIYKTSVCPLARTMRSELNKRGVKALKVVYSKEPPIIPAEFQADEGKRKKTPGSTAFTPSVAGLIIASEVIKDLIK